MTLGRRNFREIYAPSRRNLEEINKRNLRLFRKKSSPEPMYVIVNGKTGVGIRVSRGRCIVAARAAT